VELLVRVLWLFSGPRREDDIQVCLERQLVSLFAPGGVETKVFSLHFDTLHGRHFDASRPDVRKRVLDEVRGGLWDVVVASPPCNTW
jgi:hypothetical protein